MVRDRKLCGPASWLGLGNQRGGKGWAVVATLAAAAFLWVPISLFGFVWGSLIAEFLFGAIVGGLTGIPSDDTSDDRAVAMCFGPIVMQVVIMMVMTSLLHAGKFGVTNKEVSPTLHNLKGTGTAVAGFFVAALVRSAAAGELSQAAGPADTPDAASPEPPSLAVPEVQVGTRAVVLSLVIAFALGAIGLGIGGLVWSRLGTHMAWVVLTLIGLGGGAICAGLEHHAASLTAAEIRALLRQQPDPEELAEWLRWRFGDVKEAPPEDPKRAAPSLAGVGFHVLAAGILAFSFGVPWYVALLLLIGGLIAVTAVWINVARPRARAYAEAYAHASPGEDSDPGAEPEGLDDDRP